MTTHTSGIVSARRVVGRGSLILGAAGALLGLAGIAIVVAYGLPLPEMPAAVNALANLGGFAIIVGPLVMLGGYGWYMLAHGERTYIRRIGDMLVEMSAQGGVETSRVPVTLVVVRARSEACEGLRLGPELVACAARRVAVAASTLPEAKWELDGPDWLALLGQSPMPAPDPYRAPMIAAREAPAFLVPVVIDESPSRKRATLIAVGLVGGLGAFIALLAALDVEKSILSFVAVGPGNVVLIACVFLFSRTKTRVRLDAAGLTRVDTQGVVLASVAWSNLAAHRFEGWGATKHGSYGVRGVAVTLGDRPLMLWCLVPLTDEMKRNLPRYYPTPDWLALAGPYWQELEALLQRRSLRS